MGQSHLFALLLVSSLFVGWFVVSNNKSSSIEVQVPLLQMCHVSLNIYATCQDISFSPATNTKQKKAYHLQ